MLYLETTVSICHYFPPHLLLAPVFCSLFQKSSLVVESIQMARGIFTAAISTLL